MRSYVKPEIAMIHYLAIVATFIAVCNAMDVNLIKRADETIQSIEPKSTLEDLVNVELYYAALCPDAAHFVGTQLVATYQDIGNYINVTYVPYGKGTHEKLTNDDGTEQWYFTCQHGDEGCYGNKAQACAIHEILTNPEISDEQRVLIDFVGCVMSASNPAAAVPQCLETIGVNANYISSVNNCIASTEGDELLATHGDKTHALEPELTWVPTIVINEVFSQEEQDRSLVDFQGLICQYIPSENRPAVCNGSNSPHTKTNIFAITIFALIFFIGKESNYFL